MDYKIFNSAELSEEIMEKLFLMYSKSYGVTSWFKKPVDLQKYACGVIFNTDDISSVNAFLMFQVRKFGNKLSLGCHDGSDDGKKKSIRLRIEMLQKPGWYAETSGKVSWILRKHIPTKMIRDIHTIKTLLDLPENEAIKINDTFKFDDMESNYYVHEFYEDGNLVYKNDETMFGTICFNGIHHETGCHRSCTDNVYK